MVNNKLLLGDSLDVLRSVNEEAYLIDVDQAYLQLPRSHVALCWIVTRYDGSCGP